MLQYWWIPAVLAMYSINSWLSVYAKDGWRFVIALYILQIFGLWPIVARYSKNLAVDGLLFDFLILLSFYSTLWYMGQMQQFNIWQWMGFTLAIIGIFLMKGTI